LNFSDEEVVPATIQQSQYNTQIPPRQRKDVSFMTHLKTKKLKNNKKPTISSGFFEWDYAIERRIFLIANISHS